LAWSYSNTGAVVAVVKESSPLVILPIVIGWGPNSNIGVSVAVDIPGSADACAVLSKRLVRFHPPMGSG
jgi:hypothetical protein